MIKEHLISDYQDMERCLNSIDMWLMNRYSASSVWYVGNNGSGYRDGPTNTYGGRPTVHLKSTVKIISGTGTETDPYVVGL